MHFPISYHSKSFIILIFLTTLDFTNLSSQELNKTVYFKYDTTNFPNPERGLMQGQTINCGSVSNTSFTEHSKNVWAKTVSVGYTIIWKYYLLENKTDKLIPQEFIDFLYKDFELAREYGVKIIPRFVYSASATKSPPWDAPVDTVLIHIDQVAPIIQKNSDIILTWQAGWIGRHGEWAGTTHYGDYFDVTYKDSLNMAKRRAVIQKMLVVLPENRTVSMRYPKDKQGCTYPYIKILDDTITMSDAFSDIYKSRVGYFNDSYLASIDDRGTYRPKDIREDLKKHVKNDTKYVPFGGETSAFWTTDYYQPDSVFKLSDEYNLSYLHSNYHPEVIQYWKDENVWDSLTKRLGYRFFIESFSYNEKIDKNKIFKYKLIIGNVGFTPPFNPRDCEFVFIGNSDTIRIKINHDPRFWEVGKTSVEGSLSLNSDFDPGEYSIYLNLPDPEPRLNNDSRYSIRMANVGVWNKRSGFNSLNSKITIPTPPPTVVDLLHKEEVFSFEKVVVDASKSYDPEGRSLSYH